MSTIGIHSSSRAFGRSTTAGDWPVPGLAAAVPSAVSAVMSPGCDPRLVDVEEVNRELGGGIRVGGRQRRGSGGRRQGAGRRRSGRGRRRVRVDDARHGVDAQEVRPGEGDRRGIGRRGDELVDRAVRPLDADPGRAGGDGERDRRARGDRVGRRRGAAHELAREVREEHRERDLEREVGAAGLERHHRRRPPVDRARVEQRRPAGTRDDRLCPRREVELLGLADVDRREVDVAQDGVVGVGHADRRVGERPGDGAQVRRPRRRDREHRVRGQRRGEVPAEDHELELVEAGRRRVVRAGPVVELGLGQVRERGLEVRVPLTDEQDLAQRLGRDDGPRPIVDAERIGRAGRGLVRAREPDLDDRGRSVRVVDVVDRDVRAALGVEADRARLAELAVGVDLDPALHELEAQVRDRDERAVREVVGLGPDGERDDRLVVRLTPDLEDADGRLERARGRRGEGRVRGHEDLGVAGACRERRCQPERVAEVADVGRGGDRRDRLLHPAQVRRAVRDDLRRAARRDDAHLAAGREVLERVDRRGLGRVEPGGRDVGRLHRRRGVHDEDEVAREAGRSLDERPRGEDREDRDEEQLEEEQEAPAQLLPRRVRLDVGHERPPQERGRDDLPVAPQLEQVHREDDRQEREPGERDRGEEAHQPTTRRRRSSANTRSASGTSEDRGTYDARRFAARSANESCHAARRAL